MTDMTTHDSPMTHMTFFSGVDTDHFRDTWLPTAGITGAGCHGLTRTGGGASSLTAA